MVLHQAECVGRSQPRDIRVLRVVPFLQRPNRRLPVICSGVAWRHGDAAVAFPRCRLMKASTALVVSACRPVRLHCRSRGFDDRANTLQLPSLHLCVSAGRPTLCGPQGQGQPSHGLSRLWGRNPCMGARRLPVGNELRVALHSRCDRNRNRRCVSSILKMVRRHG